MAAIGIPALLRSSATILFYFIFLLNMYLNEMKIGFSVFPLHPEQGNVNIFDVAQAVPIL